MSHQVALAKHAWRIAFLAHRLVTAVTAIQGISLIQGLKYAKVSAKLDHIGI